MASDAMSHSVAIVSCETERVQGDSVVVSCKGYTL
jgi:hypothetical protein